MTFWNGLGWLEFLILYELGHFGVYMGNYGEGIGELGDMEEPYSAPSHCRNCVCSNKIRPKINVCINDSQTINKMPIFD
jgi:hypothetical protein